MASRNQKSNVADNFPYLFPVEEILREPNNQSRSDDSFVNSTSLRALPNIFPYNDMLIDGKLVLENFGVKTRSYDPGFRGPILLYTSSKSEPYVCKVHNYNPKNNIRPAIVGIGTLVDVRLLTGEELSSLLLQFNNAQSEKDIYNQERWVYPLEYGLFFEKLKRFNVPIPFTAEPGPVRTIKVPLDVVFDKLEYNGIKIINRKLTY